MLVLLTTIVSVLIFLCIYLRFSREGRLISAIPGPKGLPFIGNAFQFLLPQDQLFSRRLYKKYRSITQLHSINFRCVNVYDPEDIEKILSTTRFNDKKVPYDFLRSWLNDGLLVSNGMKWHNRRKMLTRAFHFNILKKYVQIFGEHTNNLIKKIEKEQKGAKINLHNLIMSASLGIMCEMSTGVNKEESIGMHEYLKSIEAFGDCAVERACRVWYFFDFIFNYSDIGAKQKKVTEIMHTFTKTIINDRRKILNDTYLHKMNNSSEKKNPSNLILLDLLLEKEKEMEIDEIGIREELDTFLFEGYDTTGTALLFTIMLLANYHVAQEKLHEELDRIFDSSQRIPTTEDLNEMKYLECCIKESLRLYPSVPYIVRFLKEEIVLGGYTIPAKTHANIMIYDLHRREDIYPDAEQFIPERFLPENCSKMHSFSFIPFSAGPRNCIGQKVAMLEMKTILSGILRIYQLKAVTKPEDLVLVADMVLRTKSPIYVQFLHRNKQNKN